jgi:hypothetical protein
MRPLLRLLPGLLLVGCAAVVTPSQPLRLVAEPAETVCTVTRSGERLGEIGMDRSLAVEASRAPLVLGCSATGYAPAQYVLDSVGPRSGLMGAASAGFAIFELPEDRFTRYADPIVVRLRPLAPSRTAAR